MRWSASRLYLQPVADEVLATRGRSTAWLRAAWDLNLPAGRVEGEKGGGLKCRFDHRHHFIDAAIIGVTNRRIIKGMNDLSGRLGYLPKADDPEVARFVDEPFSGFVDQVTRRWHIIWPSLRPDRSIDPVTKLPKISAELHIQTLYRALPHPEEPEKLRLASRKSLDALFGPEPPRVCRRPFGLSYAAMAGASSMA
jgi:CRISPR-associated endonuclease Csn1